MLSAIWRRWGMRPLALALISGFVVVLPGVLAALPAAAGQYQLDPGAAAWIDTGTYQYTTIIIENLDQKPGRLTIAEGRSIAIPPGERVELYHQYGGSYVAVANEGQARLQVTSIYLERPRLP